LARSRNENDGRAAFVREIAVRAEAIARDRAAPMAAARAS
jgi:hypothetical protein